MLYLEGCPDGDTSDEIIGRSVPAEGRKEPGLRPLLRNRKNVGSFFHRFI